MDATSNLSLPFIAAAQAQKHVTHNEALRALDAVVQLSVLDQDLAAPPGSPAEGARYIVAAGPTGAWAGQAGSIAAFQDGAWAFYAPQEGWLAWVADEDELYVRSGSAWVLLPIAFGDGAGITDDAGNAQLVFHKVASAVNRLGITNAATGTAPQLAAEGADTNIDLRLAAKGTGVIRANGAVSTVSSTYPPLRAERTNSGTSSPFGTLQLLATSSGDMVDGFGTNHDFAIQDNAAAVNNIGSLQFVRSGGDNSGRFRILPANGGTQATQFEIAPSGNAYFPGAPTTASAANAVLNGGSSPANELLRSTSSARYKHAVENIEDGYADSILKLRPVWYRSKCPGDNPAWSWYGLIAEEVAAVDPRLACWGYANEDYEIVRKEVDGKLIAESVVRRGAKLVPDGVAYDRLAVLLLSMVKRHHDRIQTLESRLSQEPAAGQSGPVKTYVGLVGQNSSGSGPPILSSN